MILQPPGITEDVPALLAELGLPPDTRWAWIASLGPIDKTALTTFLVIQFPPYKPMLMPMRTAGFERWHGYRFDLFGPVVDEAPAALEWPIWRMFGLPGVPDFVVQLRRQRAFYGDSPLHAQLTWRPDDGLDGRASIWGWTPETKEDAIGRARRGLKLLWQLSTAPGPKPGTVAKYATPEQWHAAIREKVLTKKTHLAADDATIALWLDFRSTSTLFDYMRRWGPKTIADLREGRF